MPGTLFFSCYDQNKALWSTGDQVLLVFSEYPDAYISKTQEQPARDNNE